MADIQSTTDHMRALHANARDLTGQKFGMLLVEGFAGRSPRGDVLWRCICECGRTKITRVGSLLQHQTRSCGCLIGKLHRGRPIGLLPDQTGQRFGRLVVIEEVPNPNGGRGRFWRCRCDCGVITNIYQGSLRGGITKSCGCFSRESRSRCNRTHGESRSAEYDIWQGIIRRCCDPNRPRYSRYGGRGIKICAEWRNDYQAFLRAVGRRPSPKHSIDRFPNNDGHYEPGNVRWATALEQRHNRPPNPAKIRKRHIFAVGAPWGDAVVRRLKWISGITVRTPDELRSTLASESGIQFVWCLNWSHIVPSDLVSAHAFVNFHAAPLPAGRGGAPLENMILRGHKTTVITCHRMTDVIDGGPIFCTSGPIKLKGHKDAILQRFVVPVAKMMKLVKNKKPEPYPQVGEVVRFTRLPKSEMDAFWKARA